MHFNIAITDTPKGDDVAICENCLKTFIQDRYDEILEKLKGKP